MSDTVTFTIDGVAVQGRKGQTILAAADAAGIYIPRLCAQQELTPFGSCRVCTVLVNGRPQAACTQPVGEGIQVESNSEQVLGLRRNLIEMLFVEGNHFCPCCEKSGNCELQALAYRFGITAPHFPYQFPERELDFTHPDVYLDRNRCVLCGRCVRASKELDGKGVFQFVRRGKTKKLGVNAGAGLRGTSAAATDKAVALCPVGSLMKKRVGYAVPVGQRRYDQRPIGADLEAKRQTAQKE